MTEQEQIGKLTERLQKAIEVFKTQKAVIERLQTERDEVQIENEKLRTKLKEFEDRINANSENEATMIRQTAEESKSKLEAELATLKLEMSSVKEKLRENVLNIINEMDGNIYGKVFD